MSLRDELEKIDWDRTPIRNFLDAKPTPKSVAGTLIKLGLISPSEADDYDWTEIDYESYPSVRKLLEDYASRIPHSKLEELLSLAGTRIKSRKVEQHDEPVIKGNPLEIHLPTLMEMEPKQALDRLADLATSPDFLEMVYPKMEEYFRQGLKPPENLFETALKKAFTYAVEVADQIIPPDEEELWKYFSFKLKSKVATNKFYKKFYPAKELSNMAIEALREANLIAKKRKPVKKEKTKPSPVESSLYLMNEIRRLDGPLKTIIGLELDTNLKRQIDTGSFKEPKKLLYNPPAFAYAVFYNHNLVEEAIHQSPAKANQLLHKLLELTEGLLELQPVMNLVAKTAKTTGIPVANRTSIRRRLAKTLALALSKKMSPPKVTTTLETENEEKTKNIRLPLTHRKEISREKEWAKNLLTLLKTFLPGLYKDIIEEMHQLGYKKEPPKELYVPTLNDPLAEVVISELEPKLKRPELLPERTRTLLFGFGLPIGEGYIKAHNDRILHEVMGVMVDGELIELRPLALLYWYDPLNGLIFKQTSEKSLRVVGLDDIFRELNKKLTYMRGVPVYTGIDAIRAVMEAGKESQLGKAFGPPKGSSSRALFTTRTIRTGSGWTRSLSKEDEENLKKLIEYGGDEIREIIEEILNRNPDPTENLHWLAYTTKHYGPEKAMEVIRCIMEKKWRFPNQPDFGSMVARTASNLKRFGMCSPF